MATPQSELDKQALHDEFQALLEASEGYDQPQRGEIRNAEILQIDEREIIVDLGAKYDGIVPIADLERLDPEVRARLKVGDNVPVYVLNRDPNDNLTVSINMGMQQYDWEKARELLKTEDVVTVEVKGHNRGGILVQWNRLEGFIPSSHLISTTSSGSRDTWDDLIGDKLTVKVIEVDQSRRRLIFSEREAQREQRALHKARLLAELKEGDVVQGKVTGLRDFGAFVNLGGADGLIHVSELAWHRVDHPRDVLRVGEEIEVYVLSLDRDTNRIALSRKRLLPDPWESAGEKYHEGQLVEGTVTNVVDFGAFVALDDGLEGLLHLSEMGNGSLKEPHSYVKKGDRLSLRISHLEPDKRRVGFTQRWGTDAAGPVDATIDGSTATASEATEEAVAEEIAEEVVAEAIAEEIIEEAVAEEIAEEAIEEAVAEEIVEEAIEEAVAEEVVEEAIDEAVAEEIVEEAVEEEAAEEIAEDAPTTVINLSDLKAAEEAADDKKKKKS